MKDVKKLKNPNFLLVLEMLFSLLLIPSGLGFVERLEKIESIESLASGALEENLVFLPLAFLCLGLTNLLRAAGNRYKKSPPAKRWVDLAFGGIFLFCSVLMISSDLSAPVMWITILAYLASIVAGRVLSIIQDRRVAKIILNAIVILGIGLLVIDGLLTNGEEREATLLLIVEIIMALLASGGFCRIMGATFANIRLDVLRDVVKKTYATEIIFGLVLLILSFSWVLVYMDPNFSSYTDALWYCFAVVTTIGFGDMTAASTVGRILSVVLGMYGIIVVALVTSVIVNFYGEMKKAGPEPDEDPALEPEEETEETNSD